MTGIGDGSISLIGKCRQKRDGSPCYGCDPKARSCSGSPPRGCRDCCSTTPHGAFLTLPIGVIGKWPIFSIFCARSARSKPKKSQREKGKRAKSYKSVQGETRRKPQKRPRSEGSHLPRLTAARLTGSSNHDPPRSDLYICTVSYQS
jgi:hypothetical protein